MTPPDMAQPTQVRGLSSPRMPTLIEKRHEHRRRPSGGFGVWYGLYRCECGNETIVCNHKANRTTKSCGCLRAQRRGEFGESNRGKFGPAHPRYGKLSTGTAEERRLKTNARKARYRARNPDKLRDGHLRRVFGITLVEYEEMFCAQGGVCAGCQQPEIDHGNPKRLSVDHDARTGRIRGLLCRRCNTALGLLADDPARLRRLADYLKEHP